LIKKVVAALESENCGAEIDENKTYCPEYHELVNNRDLGSVLEDDDIDESKFFSVNKEGQQQDDWNWLAFFGGPIWYMKQGMISRGLLLSLVSTLLSLVNLITYLIIMFYCRFLGNKAHKYYK
jgi:hypothetical protein